MVFKYREGFSFKVPAQIAGEELSRIQAKCGDGITPDRVVSEAEDERNPLHPAFEWDDEKAAHQHRMQQAREIIGAITVVVDAKPEAGPVRAFVNVNKNNERVYTGIEHAMSDPELRAQVLRQAKSELVAWRKRYATFQELAVVFAAIEHAPA